MIDAEAAKVAGRQERVADEAALVVALYAVAHAATNPVATLIAAPATVVAPMPKSRMRTLTRCVWVCGFVCACVKVCVCESTFALASFVDDVVLSLC
jgi:hypothetical protein